jgi:uncharacterized protein YggE
MKKKWSSIIILGAILILAIPALTGCSLPTSDPDTSPVVVSQQPQGIWVSGTGEVSITPDIANLNLGVVAQEANVAQAMSDASDAMAKVMKALTDSGIDLKDIQTGYFSINQRTRWDDTRQTDSVIGYQVTNMVTIKIRKTDKVGDIIDSVVQAGGDFIRINGVNFSIEDPSKYYQDARAKAMAAAKSKAEELAKQAGLTLGKATYVVENAQYSPRDGGYANFSISVPAPTVTIAAPISPGETKITLSVQVAYSVTQ